MPLRVICKSCEEEKDHLARGMCNTCYRRWQRKQNPERYREASKRWRERHPEKWKETWKRSYEKRKDKQREYSLEYSRKYAAEIAEKSLRKQIRRHGLSFYEFDELRNRGCAICRKEFSSVNPCFDHDHLTGEFRGLLCTNCNAAIGLLGDDLKSVRRAVAYLQNQTSRKEVM